MNELAELRKQIDAIDEQIIGLLKKRMEVVTRVGKHKKIAGIPALDASRFAQVLESRIEQGVKNGLSPNLVRTIWTSIHDVALEIERRL